MELTPFSELQEKKLIKKHQDKIFEFEDFYEYCLVDNYEDIFEEFHMDSVQMDNLFVSLISYKKSTKLVSLHFPKTYSIKEIIEWVESYEVAYDMKDEKGYYIINASRITESIMFKGKPIIIAKKGKEKIYIKGDNLHEITENYDYHPSITNSSHANLVEIKEMLNKNKVFLNGIEMDPFPRIDIDITQDEVYVNGVCVFADYMELAEGRLGLFSDFDPIVPIVFFQDDSNIFITTYKKSDGTIQFFIDQKVDLTEYKGE